MTAPVLAQEATPTPVAEGFVFKWGVETIFPEGVRFTIALLRNRDDLENVTLTLEVEGYEPVVEAVSFDEPITQGDNFTDLGYVWDIPDEIIPPLFGVIRFEWQAVTKNGDTARVLDQFVFQDERVQWVESDDPLRFINLTAPSDGVRPSVIRQNVLFAYNLISANAGQVLPLDIILYPSNMTPTGCVNGEAAWLVAVGSASGAELPCAVDRAEQILRASGFDVIQAAETGVSSGYVPALVGLFVRRLYEPSWSGKSVPDWFEAGLVQFYAPTLKFAWLAALRTAARNDRLYDAEQMSERRENDNELWLAQSYAMVLYLADQLGVDGLYRLAQMRDAASFADALQTAVGQSSAALVTALRRWIFTDGADLAFTYSPYLATTPTPTATATSTWTATPSPSSTPSPTLTPSVTGVLSPTPSNTPRPSITPTPRPPTVTPRPASSLLTPTPTPALVAVLDDPVQQQGILAVLFIALAIVSLLYVIVVRRRG